MPDPCAGNTMSEGAFMNSQQILEEQILRYGREIFGSLSQGQPSFFSRRFWSNLMMRWSMDRPAFKSGMFRFVDVLPSLRSPAAVIDHLSQYLATEIAATTRLPAGLLRMRPESRLSSLMAFAVRKSVEQMALNFIAHEDPLDASRVLHALRRAGLAFTVDLLGEFSLSDEDCCRCQTRYLQAIKTLAPQVSAWPESAAIVKGNPGEALPFNSSVKLSSLYSQISALNFDRSVAILSERLSEIARQARASGASLYVDAETQGLNPVIFETFKRVFASPEFRDFPCPGIVVQAYALRSRQVLEGFIEYARQRGAPIAIRLVKGAYWDYENTLCEQNNWDSPFFRIKESTDANYEALSRLLLDNHKVCFPAFASHNIRSLSHACCYAESIGLGPEHFELQMLYGMAEPIALAYARRGLLVRMYVPLGEMLAGMGYLVRRLLENTSNESFLKHTFFDKTAVDRLLQQPVLKD